MGGRKHCRRRRRTGLTLRFGRGGFTLIELLIVVAIISLLVAILLPSLANARRLAKRAACAATLHGLGTAAGLYQGDYGEYVPISWTNQSGCTNPWKCWRVCLLRYTSGPTAFNCPAAEDNGKLGETIHTVEELCDTVNNETANSGSYGVMLQDSLASYKPPNLDGSTKYPGNPMQSLAFSTAAGVSWQDPARSIYLADGHLARGPITTPTQAHNGLGTSGIFPPSSLEYNTLIMNTRRFADRHFGTNCLYVGGNCETFKTEDLESMNEGSENCVWDVY